MKIIGFFPLHIDRKKSITIFKTSIIDLIYIFFIILIIFTSVFYCCHNEYLSDNIQISIEIIAAHIQSLYSILLYFLIIIEWIYQRENHEIFLNGIILIDKHFHHYLQLIVNNRRYAKIEFFKYIPIVLFAIIFVTASEILFVGIQSNLNNYEKLFEIIYCFVSLSFYISSFYVIVCANCLVRRYRTLYAKFKAQLLIVDDNDSDKVMNQIKIDLILDLFEELWQLKIMFNQTFNKWLLYINSFDMVLLTVGSYRFLMTKFYRSSALTENENNLQWIMYFLFLLPHAIRIFLIVREIGQLYFQVK